MSKRRLYIFDNTKFILITLVLSGHFIEALTSESRAAKSIYILIYTFHMPAFVFTAGYFSKVKSNLKKTLIINIKRLFLPYLIFQFLYLIFNSLLFNYKVELNFKRPFWLMWFLLSLFFWRAAVYFFKKIDLTAKYIFISSVIFSLILGFIPQFGRLYSASRTIVFLPFFLAGYLINKETFIELKNKLNKIDYKAFSVLIFFLEIIIIYFYLNNLDLEWLYGAVPYFKLTSDLSAAVVYRALFLLAAFINISLFFIIVPKSKLSISIKGKRSIYPYLLHGFIVIFLQKINFYDNLNADLNLFISIIMALTFTFTLSSVKIRKVFKYLIEF